MIPPEVVAVGTGGVGALEKVVVVGGTLEEAFLVGGALEEVERTGLVSALEGLTVGGDMFMGVTLSGTFKGVVVVGCALEAAEGTG